MHGFHLTADLHNCRCDPAWLADLAHLGQWCAGAVRSSGLAPLGQLSQANNARSDASGAVSTTVLLAGSHVCVHTWPAEKLATIDVFLCHLVEEHRARASALMTLLIEHFVPEWTEQRSLDRGDES